LCGSWYANPNPKYTYVLSILSDGGNLKKGFLSSSLVSRASPRRPTALALEPTTIIVAYAKPT